MANICSSHFIQLIFRILSISLSFFHFPLFQSTFFQSSYFLNRYDHTIATALYSSADNTATKSTFKTLIQHIKKSNCICRGCPCQPQQRQIIPQYSTKKTTLSTHRYFKRFRCWPGRTRPLQSIIISACSALPDKSPQAARSAGTVFPRPDLRWFGCPIS